MENAEGGERGSARWVSRESADPVGSRDDDGGLRARSTMTGSSKMTGRKAGSDFKGREETCIGFGLETSKSSPCLMLAGGDGGGGPAGFTKGEKGCGCVLPWTPRSLDTTCMTVVLLTACKTELAGTGFESRPRVSPVILTRWSSWVWAICLLNVCRGVADSESLASTVCVEVGLEVGVSKEVGVLGVRGDILAVKKDVPDVEAILCLCDPGLS